MRKASASAFQDGADQLQGGGADGLPGSRRGIVFAAHDGRVRVLVPAVHAVGIERLMDRNDAGEEGGEGRQVEIDIQPEIVVRRHEHEIDEAAAEHHARRAVRGAARRPVRDGT